MTRSRIITAIALTLLMIVDGYAQEPSVVVGMARSTDTIYWYTGAPVRIPIIASPREAEFSISENAILTPMDMMQGRYLVTVNRPHEGVQDVCVKVEFDGRVASECVSVVVERPEMRGGIDRWRALRATVGRKYNPSSEWVSINMPAAHYQTTVEINGKPVFNRPGFSFHDPDLPGNLIVTTEAKDIRTTVYWKPNGTADRMQWVQLAANYPLSSVAVPLGTRKFEIAYQPPEQTEGFEYEWMLTKRSLRKDFGPIVLAQDIGGGKRVGVQASTLCSECDELRISHRLIRIAETQWTLSLGVDNPLDLSPSLNGRELEIGINMKGRGDAPGFGVVSVMMRYDQTDSLDALIADTSPVSPNLYTTLNTQPAFPIDTVTGALIRSLKPFQGKDIAIFRMEGEVRKMIIGNMQAADEAVEMKRFEAICKQLYDQPLSDCFETIRQLLSSARTNNGRSYPAFKLAVAHKYGIDPGDLKDAELMDMLGIVQWIVARRAARPSGFYLVTSREKKPRIIGLVGTTDDPISGSPIVMETFTGSALDKGFKRFGTKLKAQLPRLLPSAMIDEEAELVKIWPR